MPKSAAVVAIRPTVSFAGFVLADIKGGVAAHAFRLGQVAHAIEQSLKGNFDPIKDAAKLSVGKAKKSAAYTAGFSALGAIAKVQYVGALSLPENKTARDTIASETARLLGLFDVAFRAVIDAKPIPKTKVSTDAAPAGESDAKTDADSEVSTMGTNATHDQALIIESTVDSLVRLMHADGLTVDQIDRIRAALAAHDKTSAHAQQAALIAAPVAAPVTAPVAAPKVVRAPRAKPTAQSAH